MPYTPTTWFKDGETPRVAYSPTEATELGFAGWTLDPDAPLPDFEVSQQLEDEIREIIGDELSTYTGFVTLPQVQALIDAVLDGAPAALDTLNELAAALADNADFAASMTALLAAKQDKNAILDQISAFGTPATNSTLMYVSGTFQMRTLTQTKTTLGISNVDNTSDANKPVSGPQASALAPKASPTFTGTVTLPNTVQTGSKLEPYGYRNAAATLTLNDVQDNIVDAFSAAFTLTLPTTTTPGYRFRFTKLDGSANVVTIAGSFVDAYSYPAALKLYGTGQWVEVMSSTTSGVWYITAFSDCVVPNTTVTDAAYLPSGCKIIEHAP